MTYYSLYLMEVCAVGGYGEIGRNMTAVRIAGKVVIFDMGLHLPNFISLSDTLDEYSKVSESSLKAADAIPQDKVISDWREEVVAIMLSHAHLDHIGAVPYLVQKYDAPVVCSPFTAAVLRSILQDEQIYMDNDIIEVKPSKRLKLSGLTLELVHVTHSTPQAAVLSVHSSEGVILYGNDYKLDDTPMLGKPPDYSRLEKLGDKGVSLLIQDCLYATHEGSTPSEQDAQERLEAVLSSCDPRKALVVTTFSSQIARLKAIAGLGRKLGRKVIFAGRSLAKYIYAAKDSGVADLTKNAKVLKYSRQTRAALRDVRKKGKERYLLVVSGHQGEPNSTLSKMSNGTYDWKFAPGDCVVFSSHTIPAEINVENRKEMDAKLLEQGVKVFSDVHASGHSYRDDIRRMIELTRPEFLIPTHGEPSSISAFCKMAKPLGYEKDKTLFVLNDGDRITL